MALLNATLVDRIIGVAKSYADGENTRLRHLDDEGHLTTKPAAAQAAGGKSKPRRADK